MVLVNRATNEMTLKLVYYGPGLCGKTTNLEKIYGNPQVGNKGKMISMATETDRTLFFDFMPMELGTIAGQKIRVQLYTVPGQVFYDATRKLVLRGADGVVFVADSQRTMVDSNIQSLENLKTNLRLNRLDPKKIALVFQYNKRDLPNVSSVEEMTSYLEPGAAPVVEAAAIEGKGVTQTLRAAVGRILENLKSNVNYRLDEDDEAAAPAPAQAPAPAVLHAGEPPGNPAVGPAVAPPPPPPPPAENPFQVDVSALHMEPEEASPFAGDVSAVDGREEDAARLQALHVRSQELMRTLESALELARKQEEQIAKLMQE
jgi:mutual gliding-motility protein MglA